MTFRENTCAEKAEQYKVTWDIWFGQAGSRGGGALQSGLRGKTPEKNRGPKDRQGETGVGEEGNRVKKVVCALSGIWVLGHLRGILGGEESRIKFKSGRSKV